MNQSLGSEFGLAFWNLENFFEAYFLYLDFVYYEGDGFDNLLNPYVPLDVDNPTIHGNDNQRQLIGEGKAFEERKEILKNKDKNVIPLIFGKLCQNRKDYLKAFADELKSERSRIGGNWAVAHACLFTCLQTRDYFRGIFLKHAINSFELSISLLYKNWKGCGWVLQNSQKVQIMYIFFNPTTNRVKPK